MIRKPHLVTGTAAAAVLLLVVCPAPAPAGTQDGAVVALHATPHAKGDPCGSAFEPVQAELPCRDFTTTWPLDSPCDVYLVVARGDPGPGILGVSFGILYNHGETGGATRSDMVGVEVYGWIQCASRWGPDPPGGSPDDEFPSSGGGIRLIWNSTDCQTTLLGSDGVHTVAGTFYLFAYSDDLFEITPNRSIASSPEEFQVGDCYNTLTDLPYPEAAGAVAFGSGTGRNPCAPTPVRPVTWSTLKQTYPAREGHE